MIMNYTTQNYLNAVTPNSYINLNDIIVCYQRDESYKIIIIIVCLSLNSQLFVGNSLSLIV